jgi:hypothetical protein
MKEVISSLAEFGISCEASRHFDDRWFLRAGAKSIATVNSIQAHALVEHLRQLVCERGRK